MKLSAADRQEFLKTITLAAPKVAPQLAAKSYELGLAVTDRHSAATTPIPVTATPEIIATNELERRVALAHIISSATLKMSKAVLNSPLRSLIVDALSPKEKELALATYSQLSTLVTTRVDFFVGTKVSALEVNATIPAMQGYSDMAAHSWIEAYGKLWNLSPQQVQSLQESNGSNTRALFEALCSGYAKVRSPATPNRIALLCRRNDAQLTEQQYLARQFTHMGIEADVVYPDQLSGDSNVMANGKAYDLIYRHLFVRRLEEPDMQGAEFVTKLLAEPNGTRAVVLNPPASQVEVKSVFALLSEALENPTVKAMAALTDDELAAISQAVPWTRTFRGDALLRQVQANPDRYVLKRSWDYGGRAVFVGRTRNEEGFQERARLVFGAPLQWNEVCARAVVDNRGGGFVVQEIVQTEPQAHLLCLDGQAVERSLFVDFSAYASVGIDPQPKWGGVCRGSASHIVNIVGGGGVVPLITEDTASQLLMAQQSSLR